MLIVFAGMLALYVFHSVWVTSEAYSSPSIVLAAKSADGSSIIFDDYREAYSWLRHNTPPDAKVMSWWDYGYQVSAIANRTTIIDNNTWNNTHIATVALAFASAEAQAIKVLEMLSVDYVMVVFGGLTGMASDDMNKFRWMARVAEGVFDGNKTVAGIRPIVYEQGFESKHGDMRCATPHAPLCFVAADRSLTLRCLGQGVGGREPVAGGESVVQAVVLVSGGEETPLMSGC